MVCTLSLKNKAKRDERLLGIYVPYWTYDSHTDSYIVANAARFITSKKVGNGHGRWSPTTTNTTSGKIRWTPVSGRIRLFFDDVLVGATNTLPRAILDRLEPWDLNNLVPYDESYISGFQSEIYQVDLDEGFEQASRIMDNRIYNAVLQDIGAINSVCMISRPNIPAQRLSIYCCPFGRRHSSLMTKPIALSY